MTDTPTLLHGSRVRRLEDAVLVTGRSRYVDDLPLEGSLHLAFVRSPVAHAIVRGVETGEAVDLPGVAGIFVAGDLRLPGLVGFEWLSRSLDRPPLATDRVRFVGEPVAAVVAETRAQAVDAAELVFVDYDPLPAVTDPEAAGDPEAPLLFEDHGSNVAFEVDNAGQDDLLEGAEIVVSGRFVNHRVAPSPMETNAFAASPDPETGGVSIWASTQRAHALRDAVATALDLNNDQVRVRTPHVGGGFGAKFDTYAELLVVAAIAQRTQRTVKWVETRSENLVGMTHGRAQIQYVDLGLRRDGTFVGLRERVVQDSGAYPAMGAVLPGATLKMAPGPYDIRKLGYTAQSMTTNTTTTSAYRGAGRPEATGMLERIIDIAAGELGVDPVQLRLQNLARPEDMPVTTITDSVYDVGDYPAALQQATDRLGYEQLRAEQRERRQNDATHLLGVGVSVYLDVTPFRLSQEYAAVDIDTDEDGGVRVTIAAGTSDHGQGHATVYAMIMSDVLGIPIERVQLVQGDTALVPTGFGTGSARSLQIGGSAVNRSAEEVLAKGRELAGHLLEVAPDDVVPVEGGLGVRGAPARAVGWAELATAARDRASLPTELAERVGARGLGVALDWEQDGSTYPYGAHAAAVEIDRETGHVTLRRFVAVEDCGRVLNPLIVEGQQHGGITQGIGQALFETVQYDEDGNPLSSTFLDYSIPSAADVPDYDVANMETPTHLNPLGAKGIGQGPTIGSTFAVQNAVIDALSHLGVTHLDMPFTPERVWRAMHEAG